MAQSKSAVLTSPKPNVAGASTRKQFWSADNPTFWLIPAFLFLLLYSVFPLFYNLIISLHEWKTRAKVFEFVGLENWNNLLGGLQVSLTFEQGLTLTGTDPRFWGSVQVTFTYMIVALVIQLVLGFLIALLLDARPWGAGIMQTLIILPMVTAPAVAGMLFRLLEHSDFGAISWFMYGTGLLEKAEPLMGGTGKYAMLGLWIVDTWQWTPFFVLIILAGLKGLPSEVLEASEVDGASWFQRLTRIKVPLLGGVLTVAILFRLIDLYKVFDYVLIMTAGGPGVSTTTMSYYGYINSFSLIKWGYGAAIGLVIMILAWVTAFAYTKIFRVKW